MAVRRSALLALYMLIFTALWGCATNTPTPRPTERAITGSVITRVPTMRNVLDRANPSLDVGTRIALAAEEQVGVTTIYDASYVRLTYPNGDVPIERGTCTDVVIRAFRMIGVDLQAKVHEDMKRNFSVYPKDWGLSAPDPNIDHRRVQNLSAYFRRMGKEVRGSSSDESFKPGDVVAWQLSGWMQHIGIMAVDTVPGTNRHYAIHNIGGGTQKEDMLKSFPIIGQYRW